jgi:hypothetical protein
MATVTESIRMSYVGQVASMGMGHAKRNTVEELKGKRRLKKTYAWEDNIKMDLGESVCRCGLDSTCSR